MKITVIDFLELVNEEKFDIYLNGIQVGEGVEYYGAKWRYIDKELPPLLDRAMECNVVKVDFKFHRVFAGDAE